MDPFQKNLLQINEQFGYKGLSANRTNNLKNSRPDGIVILGMGGSGLAGEILRHAQGELGLKLPVIIWKDYHLPKVLWSAKRPLYIFVSFSGNTEETVSGLETLLKTKPRLAAAIITTGGKLKP